MKLRHCMRDKMYVDEYIYVKRKFLTEDECDKLFKTSSIYKERDLSYFGEKENKPKNYPNSGMLNEETLLNHNETFNDKIKKLAQEYYNRYTNNLLSLTDLSDGLIHYYGKGTSFDDHIDDIHGLFDGKKRGVPQLSTITSLSSDYEGGEIVFNYPGSTNEINFKLNCGDVIIFPSCFIYKHYIKTITDGYRCTIVKWLW